MRRSGGGGWGVWADDLAGWDVALRIAYFFCLVARTTTRGAFSSEIRCYVCRVRYGIDKRYPAVGFFFSSFFPLHFRWISEVTV